MPDAVTVTDAPQRVIPARRGKGKTRVTRALRRRQVISRLLAGQSNTVIAEELAIKPERVSKIISDVLATWEGQERNEVDKVRALQIAKLDRLASAHFDEAIGRAVDAAKTEEQGATVYKPPSRASAELILKVESLRADLVGTKAAKKLEVSGSLGFHLDPEEVEREQRAWLASGGDAVDSTAREISP